MYLFFMFNLPLLSQYAWKDCLWRVGVGCRTPTQPQESARASIFFFDIKGLYHYRFVA
jgi:hypothetical protein